METVNLPDVAHLYMWGTGVGELFAAGDDGRVTALVPIE